MSYIRSTSNPEKLWIYDDGDRHVMFVTSGRTRLRVPHTTFRHLMKSLKKEDWKISISYKGFKISEDQRTFKWKIAYKSDHMFVHQVTLKYILDNNDWT